MSNDALRAPLVELVEATSKAGIRLFLAGGYGLYLKQLELMSSTERTLSPRESWPRPRATSDLDVFVPAEIVVSLAQMVQLRQILDDLGYQPVPGGEFMHFDRAALPDKVRVELLAGPIALELRPRMKIRGSRIRPKGDLELHAFWTEEALCLEVEPFAVGLGHGLSVLIPNVFSLLLMKLHACRDRLADENKQFGRHHALDVYRLLAMLTEAELELARRLFRTHAGETVVKAASKIVEDSFASVTSVAVLRMREHALAGSAMERELPRLLAVLHDLLLTGASGPVGSLLSSRSAEAPPEQVAPRRPV